MPMTYFCTIKSSSFMLGSLYAGAIAKTASMLSNKNKNNFNS